MLTWHVPVPLHPPPLQPVNSEPGSGTADSVTTVPWVYVSIQEVPGQSIVPTSLVTLPLPLPAKTTVNVWGGGGGPLDTTATVYMLWPALLSWNRLTAHLGEQFYENRVVRGILNANPEGSGLPDSYGGWTPAVILAAVTLLSLAIAAKRVQQVEDRE